MPEEAVHLPVPFPLGEPQMRVHQVQASLRTVDLKQLRAAGLPRALPEENPVPALDRPTREHEIAIATVADRHVRLIDRMGPEVAGEESRLIIELAPPHEPIHLLQADEVGILSLNAVDDPGEGIPPVTAADPLVNVPAQQSHGWWGSPELEQRQHGLGSAPDLLR